MAERKLTQCLYIHDALAGTRKLFLNGQSYTVAPRGQGLVDLTREDTAEVHAVGLWGCTCRDYLYRQQKVGGMCKHTLALIAVGLLGEPTADLETLPPADTY